MKKLSLFLILLLSLLTGHIITAPAVSIIAIILIIDIEDYKKKKIKINKYPKLIKEMFNEVI